MENTAASASSEEGSESSNAELKMLEGELASIQELSFAFRRAASRLTEMSSSTYDTVICNRST